MQPVVRSAAILLMCVAAAACSKKQVKEAPPPPVVGSSANSGANGADASSGVANGGRFTQEDLDRDSCLRNRVVYFDLDSDITKPEFRESIGCHAKYLRDRPQAHVKLEGNTDERGSNEYNLALGERRARSVSSVMQAMGAASSQIDVVSYGEESPVCRESSEACWSKNRRVEILYTTP